MAYDTGELFLYEYQDLVIVYYKWLLVSPKILN